MSFNITLYQNESPVEKIGKTLSNSHTVTDVVLKKDTSVLKPVLLINSVQDVYEYNYLEIAEFNRKYFIDDIRSVNNNLWEVAAHVDVLDTYASEILANTAVIRRQQNKYNLYLDDPEFKTYNYEQIQTLQFPVNAFDKTLSYVLTVNGSVSS